jgi:serine/threonine protein kinase
MEQGAPKSSMLCGWGADEDDQARLKAEFVSEIRQLARLRHPCITTIMGAVMPSRRDEPMLVMEYMTHGSLFDVLQDESISLKSEHILAILQDVAQGLRFLHSAKPLVVHGDLKAQNVLIDTNFCAKVTDFGLSSKKQIGAVGTPYWMAPELLKGLSSNTAASDIYAFGMVIYEIYSGQIPYENERYDEVMRLVCDPLIRKRPPVPVECPPKIAKLMMDCLMHSPNERPKAEQLDLMLKVELKVNERTSRLQALNRDLEEANHKIASASEIQLQHFACMSHEIRTPLNCIVGLSSLLEETELNPMQQESMEMIVSSGKLLRQIVDDVLDCKYGKREFGFLVLNMSTHTNICLFVLSQILN